MFHGRRIYIVPYVAEKGWSLDNLPLDFDKQKPLLNDLGVNVDKITNLTKGRKERWTSNLEEFIQWLQDHLGELRIPDTKREINLVLVTHSNFIKREFKLKHKPANNSVVMKEFLLNESPNILTYPGFDAYYPKRARDYCPDTCRRKTIKCPKNKPFSKNHGTV
jgi:hypothetical protein